MPCPNGHTEYRDGCTLCGAARKDNRYAVRWGLPVQTSTVDWQRRAQGIPCIHRGEATGERVTCPSCPSQRGIELKLLHCAKYGTCTVQTAVPGKACCATCNDYVPRAAVRAATPTLVTGCGVAIGCYGWPQLVETQIRLLRLHNPGVPILVADDASPAAAQLEALEDAYPDVTVWVSPARRGHYAGDLSVFWKAVHWGATRDFRHVVKLSQRMLVDRPGWVAEACKLLIDTPAAAIAAQGCIDRGTNLYVRSELAVLDVTRWRVPAILERLDRERLENPTELYLNGIIHEHLGGAMAAIPWLAVDRYARSEGCCWHCSHTLAEYVALATRVGVTLDADFDTDGRQHKKDWVRG